MSKLIPFVLYIIVMVFSSKSFGVGPCTPRPPSHAEIILYISPDHSPNEVEASIIDQFAELEVDDTNIEEVNKNFRCGFWSSLDCYSVRGRLNYMSDLHNALQQRIGSDIIYPAISIEYKEIGGRVCL